MYKSTAFLLPALLALVHIASAAPAPSAFPDTKREALPDPQDGSAQFDSASSVFPTPTPAPAAPVVQPGTTTSVFPSVTPAPAAAPSFNVESYISYLENLTLDDNKVKRGPAAAPAPTAAVNAKRQDGSLWGFLGGILPEQTVAGQSEEGAGPTVMGVSEAQPAATPAGVSMA